MVNISDLPRELVDAILIQAIIVRGVKRGLRLRLVNSTYLSIAALGAMLTGATLLLRRHADEGLEQFAIDVKQALFQTRLLDDAKCQDTQVLKAYYMCQIFCDRKITIEPLRTVGRVAQVLCEEMESDLRGCIEALCTLTFECGRVAYSEWLEATPYDKNFQLHLLVAAAYMNCIPLVNRLLATLDLPNGFTVYASSLFGSPATAAASQGNNEILELILKNNRRSCVWALVHAGANGHLSTLELLLEPRWHFRSLPDSFFHKAIWRGLTRNSSIAMFTRAYPLISEWYPWPYPNRIVDFNHLGFFLKCAVEHGHVMLALHLLHVGAPVSGYCQETFGEENPFWNACKTGNEPSVRLLLGKGAKKDMDDDMPLHSPLQVAANRGHLEIVRTLLKFGADPQRASRDGPPPIVYAIKLEHVAMFQLLQKHGANITASRTSRLAFDIVAKDGLESMAELLLEEGAEPTEKAVVTALEHGNYPVAEIFRGHTSDITIEVADFWDKQQASI